MMRAAAAGDLDRLEQAMSWLSLGACQTLVKTVTGLSGMTVAALADQLGQAHRQPGRPPERLLPPRSAHHRYRLLIFSLLYQRQAMPPAPAVARAYRLYRQLAPAGPAFNFNLAWRVAGQLRARRLNLFRCRVPACGHIELVTGDQPCTACPQCGGSVAPLVIRAADRCRPATARPLGAVSATHITALRQAIALLAHGASLTVVQAVSRIGIKTLRRVRPSGASRRAGPLPSSAGALLQPRHRAVQAALAALLWQSRRRGSPPAGASDSLWQVWTVYQQLAPPLRRGAG